MIVRIYELNSILAAQALNSFQYFSDESRHEWTLASVHVFIPYVSLEFPNSSEDFIALCTVRPRLASGHSTTSLNIRGASDRDLSLRSVGLGLGYHVSEHSKHNCKAGWCLPRRVGL